MTPTIKVEVDLLDGTTRIIETGLFHPKTMEEIIDKCMHQGFFAGMTEAVPVNMIIAIKKRYE